MQKIEKINEKRLNNFKELAQGNATTALQRREILESQKRAKLEKPKHFQKQREAFERSQAIEAKQ